MSILAELKPAEGSTHYRKRVGRGKGSGLGQTAGKGHKGQLARTGGKVRRGFEGGQTPLIRRLPKFGFSNVAFANRFETISTADLNRFDGTVDAAVLQKAGLVKSTKIKLLLKGELTKKVIVKLSSASEGAKSAVEKAGGKFEVV
jgi:large subunit ribosomal protein L15